MEGHQEERDSEDAPLDPETSLAQAHPCEHSCPQHSVASDENANQGQNREDQGREGRDREGHDAERDAEHDDKHGSNDDGSDDKSGEKSEDKHNIDKDDSHDGNHDRNHDDNNNRNNDRNDSDSDSDSDNQEEEQPLEPWIHELRMAIESDSPDARQILRDNDAALEARFPYQFDTKEVEEDEDDDLQKNVTPLILAAGSGHEDLVEIILEQGADIFATTKDSFTAFHLAAQQGHEKIVQSLLDKGGVGCLELTTQHGQTPLLCAAYRNRTAVFKLLLEKGADTNAVGLSNFTPLHFAADKGNIDLVKLIFTLHPDLLERQSFALNTALIFAAEGGHLATVEYLLSQGANLNAKNRDGNTSLHLAAQRNHLDVVQRLLEANPKLLDIPNNHDTTAFLYAASEGHLAVVEYLLSQGANPNVEDDTHYTALHLAAFYGYLEVARRLLRDSSDLLERRTSWQDTAFTLAAQAGEIALVKYLLDQGSKFDVYDQFNDTALHLAAMGGHLDVVQFLIENTEILHSKDVYAQTAICTALSHDHIDVFDYLVEKGADIKIKDGDGNTSFHCAATRGHLSVVERILSMDPNVLNSKGINERTAIFLAIVNDHLAVFDYLLDKGADIKAEDEHGTTPFHYAAMNDHLPVIERILSKDPNMLNSKGPHGRTAIFAAVANENLALFDYLFDKGAALADKDEDGDTLLNCAVVEGGYLHVVRQILSKEPGLLNSRGKYNQIPILAALRYGHLKIFDYLFNEGADIVASDDVGDTPFYCAIERGYLQAVRQILAKEPGLLNSKSSSGLTPISTALYSDRFDVFDFLFNEGADTTARNENGNTSLHYAALNGHCDAVQQLLTREPSLLNLKGRDGRTAISLTLPRHCWPTFDYLFKVGADITAQDEDGNTSLYYAAENGYLQAIKQILEKKPDLLNSRNKAGQTAISTALVRGHLDVFDYLFNKDANINTRDEDGNTPFHNAAKGGHREAVEKLLAKDPSLLDIPGNAGQTGLILASQGSHDTIAEFLIGKGANILWHSELGQNALHVACWYGSDKIVTLLLNAPSINTQNFARKSQWMMITATDMRGDSALTIATTRRDRPIVFHLLETEVFYPQYPAKADPYRLSDEKVEEVSSFLLDVVEIWTEDKSSAEINAHGEAVRYWALLNGQEELVAKFLKLPTGLHSFGPWQRGVSWVHVAALGGHTKMIEYLILEKQCSLAPTRDRISPLHLAIKHQHMDLVNHIIAWLGGSSPAEGGQEIEKIREKVRAKKEDKLLEAIIRKQDEGHSSISLAASKPTETHRKLQLLLLDTLDKSIVDKTDFFSLPLKEDTQLVLELTAQFEPPGEEVRLASFLRQIHASTDTSAFNSFHLAVYHKLPFVVWWLLSNGGYLKGNHIEKGLEIISKWEPKQSDLAGNMIRGILDDPPPLIKRQASGPETSLPSFNFSSQDHGSLEGTVLDFYREENRASIQLKRRTMASLIYEEGLQQFSTLGQYRDLRLLKEKFSSPEKSLDPKPRKREDKVSKTEGKPLKSEDKPSKAEDKPPKTEGKLPKPEDKLSKSRTKNDGTDSTIPAGEVKDSTAIAGEKDRSSSEKQRILDLRWIHVPANNMRSIEELMIRISRDQQTTDSGYRPWAQFVRRSWVELPAGGEQFYMKPQCVHHQHTHLDGQTSDPTIKVEPKLRQMDKAQLGQGAKTDGQSKQVKIFGRCALNMPYVFWKKCPKTAPSNDTTGSAKSPKSTSAQTAQNAPTAPTSEERITHESMTLDQYYYVSLTDTTDRDRDQVLWRSTDPNLKPKSETCEEGNPTDISGTDDEHRKILIVNQLWLWIIDESMAFHIPETIITSTTHQVDEAETSFLQRVLSGLRTQETNKPMSVEYIRELILSTASGLFIKGDVDVLGKKKSPLDVYREAILTVRDKEKVLFDLFQKSLDHPETDNGGEDENDPSSTKQLANEGTPASQNLQEKPRFIDRLFKPRSKDPKTETTYNPYGDISGETKLLREVKDICDELQMLKVLAEDQEDVWKQIWKDGYNPDATFTYETPSEIRAEIKEMIKNAGFVQGSIDMLLNLKQKQANIVEAEFARKQSEETSKQSDTIMVFTVVTILFLPASFLTSLLALDISDFPHVNDDVRFEGRLIFPIIFGVSVLVSGLFALLAFNASTLKSHLFGKKHKKTTKKKDDSIDQESANPSGIPSPNQPPVLPHELRTTTTQQISRQLSSQRLSEQTERIRERRGLRNRLSKDSSPRSSFEGSEQMV